MQAPYKCSLCTGSALFRGPSAPQLSPCICLLKGKTLPIFYLNIRDGDILIEDPEGQEFSSVHAAKDEAIHSAREMLAEKVRLGEVIDGQRIEIMDAVGDQVAVVPFKELLYIEGSSVAG
jgi:hypothetical protein